MKQRALKSKDDCLFWSSAKRRKGFSKISDIVKSSLQKWIISHPHAIQYTIVNNYITVRFYDLIRGMETELYQRVLLQLSVREPHIDIQKNVLLGFP